MVLLSEDADDAEDGLCAERLAWEEEREERSGGGRACDGNGRQLGPVLAAVDRADRSDLLSRPDRATSHPWFI